MSAAEIRELQHDLSRSRWIAQSAVARMFNGDSIESIETEPLEALYHFIGFELQDRDLRERARRQPLAVNQDSPF